MSCCKSPEDKQMKNSLKKSRNEQLKKDMMQKQQESLFSTKAEQLRRKCIEMQEEQRQMARKHTEFVQQIENEKQEFILKWSQQLSRQRTVTQQYKDREKKFKKGFQRDILDNDAVVKRYIKNIEQFQQISQLKQLKNKDLDIEFRSIRQYYGSQSIRSSIQENSEVVIMKLLEVYNLFKENKIFQAKILLCVSYYIHFLEDIILKGYSEKIDGFQLKESRETMKELAKNHYQKFERLIQIAKEKFTKERSRILEQSEVNNSLEQIKLRNKIEELEKTIQQLMQENNHIKQENEILTSSTLPNLREKINQKENRGLEQIKQILIYMQKDQLEAMRYKDSTIQKLQAQLNRFQIEKSQFSEDTEADKKQLTHDQSQKDKEIEQIHDKIRCLPEFARQKSLSELKSSNTSYDNRSQSLIHNKQIESKNKQINELNKQVHQVTQQAQKELSRQQEIISKLEDQIQNNKLTIDQMTEKINQLESSNQKFSQQISELNSEASLLKSQNQQYATLMRHTPIIHPPTEIYQKQEERQWQQINSGSQNLETENQVLKIHNKSLLDEVQNQKKINQELQDINHRLNKKLQEEQLKRSEFEGRVYKAESEVYDWQGKMAKMENIKKQCDEELLKIKEELVTKQNELNELRAKMQIIEKELDQANKKRDRQVQEINQQKQLCMELQQRIQVLQNDNTADLKGRMRTASFVQHKTLFIGTVLEKRKGQKKFLMDSIEELMGKDIETTERLYEFKRDGKSNFHNYIDGHRNIVLIVQTQKALIACYYSGIVQESPPMTEEGLILSLDTRKKFLLNTFKNNPSKDPKDNKIVRGMIYDKYFLIFGNAEVRIRTGESKVFSNFGIMNGFYDSKKEKVDALLHLGSSNEVDLINYEIHEVIFIQEQFSYEQTSL